MSLRKQEIIPAKQQKEQLNVANFFATKFLLYVTITLYSVNFMARMNYWALSILLLTFVWLAVFGKYTIRFSSNFVVISVTLALFLVSFVISSSTYGTLQTSRGLYVLIGCMALLVFGYILVITAHGKQEILVLIALITVSTTCLLLYSVLMTLHITGKLSFWGLGNSLPGGRTVYYPWSGTFLAATNMGGYAVFGLSLIGVQFAFTGNSPERRFKKIVLVCSVISFLSASFIGNRSSIILIIIVYLSSLLLTLYLRQSVNRVVLYSVGLVIIFYWIINSNILGLATIIEESFINQRFRTGKLIEDPRIEMWRASISYFITHPMGGQNFNSHNLWLDVAVTGGVVPLVFLLLFTGLSIHSLAKLLSCKNNSNTIKYIFLNSIVGLIALMASENVVKGFPFVLAEFCLLTGMICALNFRNLKAA